MTTIQTNTMPQGVLDAMNPQTTATSASDAADAQNRFLTLLVTQMKNQDPLNPLDNAEVTSQLAQLSTVTGIDKLNTTLSSLVGSSQATQAASMIGHGVLVPGSSVDLGSSGSAYMGVDLSAPADSMKVNIRDSSGKIVDTMDVGRHDTGIAVLQWDGKTSSGDAAPVGTYTFDISATSAGQNVASSNVTALSFGTVNSVSTSATGAKLNVSGVGAVDMTDVRQIL